MPVVLCALAISVSMSRVAITRVEGAPAASTEPNKDNVHLAQEAARVANDIGVRTFVRLESVKHGDNSILSPVSLGVACALLADGCHGATKNTIAKAISPTAALPSQAAWSALCTSLLSPSKGVQQQLGTAIFADQGVKFLPAFVQQAKNAFQADCKPVSMGSPSAIALIDQWVAAHTKGRVSSSLSHLSPEDVVLLSALYFKGEWTDKFLTTETHPADFTLTSGKQKKVPMMSKDFIDHPGAYYENADVQVIALAYGQPHALTRPSHMPLMYIILPKKKDGFQSLCTKLTAAQIEQWTGKLNDEHGILHLPRFRLISQNHLKSALASLGMGSLFSGQSDFSSMFARHANAMISEFNQSLWLDLNENGTEAAALTEVDVYLGISSEKPFVMNCNHPFLFVLKDEPSGAIEFIGTVTDPIDGGISPSEQEKKLLSEFDSLEKPMPAGTNQTDRYASYNPRLRAGMELMALYSQQKRYKDAAKICDRSIAFETTLNKQPENPVMLQQLLRLQVLAGMLPETEATFERLFKLFDQRKNVHDSTELEVIDQNIRLNKILGRSSASLLVRKENFLKAEIANAVKTAGPKYTHISDEQLKLADFYIGEQRYKDAEPLLAETRTNAAKETNGDYVTLNVLKDLQKIYRATGRSDKADALSAEIAPFQKKYDETVGELKKQQEQFLKDNRETLEATANPQEALPKTYLEIFGNK